MVIESRLSIIIPVYRVERTLDECVRSVLSVCGDDAQVILVDDGSPDACPQMCDEWAGRDARIEVVHRRNGGLSAARNSGLAIARGEWITFVDSDDVVYFDFDRLKNSKTQKLSAAEKLKNSPDVDIIEYPVRRHYQTDDEVLMQWGDCTFDSSSDYWTATEGWTHCYAWNKIYRRSLFDGVRFPEGRTFEDVWTIPLLLKRARTVHTTTSGWYGYRDNPSGITMTAGGVQLTDLLEGNINAVCVMHQCDVRHYAAMVNMQLDVYRMTGRMILPRRRFALRDLHSLSWSKRMKLMLPLRLLCRLHKVCFNNLKNLKQGVAR